MNAGNVKRAILNVQSGGEDGGVRVDILGDSRVRLRLVSPEGTRDLFCDTLEDVFLLAAAESALTGALYEQLVWELDLLGLRGA